MERRISLGVLLVLIIIGTYYLGYNALAQTIGPMILNFFNLLTGRNSSGQPSGYAGGGSTAVKAA